MSRKMFESAFVVMIVEIQHELRTEEVNALNTEKLKSLYNSDVRLRDRAV